MDTQSEEANVGLRELRKERDLSLEAVSVLSDVDIATVSRIEAASSDRGRKPRSGWPVDSGSRREGCRRSSTRSPRSRSVPEPLLLPARRAFEELGIGRDHGYELVRAGRLRAVYVGRRSSITTVAGSCRPIHPSRSRGTRWTPGIGWRAACVGSSTTASFPDPHGGSIRSTQRPPTISGDVSTGTRLIRLSYG